MEIEALLSSITVVELEHGLHRAGTVELARKRREYRDTVFAAISVEPFTRENGPTYREDRCRGQKSRTYHPVL
jgi:hypothetical protein